VSGDGPMTVVVSVAGKGVAKTTSCALQRDERLNHR
jgi:hypothetical protein